LWYQNNIK